jgi:hypothetical protein
MVTEIKIIEWRQQEKCIAYCNKYKLGLLYTVATKLYKCKEYMATKGNKHTDCMTVCNVNTVYCVCISCIAIDRY